MKWTLFLKTIASFLLEYPAILAYGEMKGQTELQKKALQTHISNTKIPYTDLKPLINKFILKKWPKSWDDQTHNKLHHIQDTIGEWPAGYRSSIGHTHITHSHLLKGEDSPVCSTCKVPLTVKHILINCDSFSQICPKHYQTNNLKDLFKNSKPEEILSFLKSLHQNLVKYNKT